MEPNTPATTGALSSSAPTSAQDDAHDRELIIERLAWTPEQRLDANIAFLRFYLSARPQGPLITGER